jgi:Zn-dependent peptidase ImmA (M78 family)
MDYRKTRDLTWKLLLKSKISSLPVSVEEICNAEKIRLFTYREGKKLIHTLNLNENIVGNDAFSIRRVIFYDDTKPPTRQRFSVAHEIGHVLLHNKLNQVISPNDNAIESEANIFASRLLAPLCVLHFLNVQSAEDISEICNISMAAAKIRYQRLCDIRKRDDKMESTKGKGVFLLSPLERKLLLQFERFISENKR